MKTYPPKEANCDLCDRAFSDENLIVLLTIYDDPPRFTGVMAPALAYVACGPCIPLTIIRTVMAMKYAGPCVSIATAR